MIRDLDIILCPRNLRERSPFTKELRVKMESLAGIIENNFDHPHPQY